MGISQFQSNRYHSHDHSVIGRKRVWEGIKIFGSNSFMVWDKIDVLDKELDETNELNSSIWRTNPSNSTILKDQIVQMDELLILVMLVFFEHLIKRSKIGKITSHFENYFENTLVIQKIWGFSSTNLNHRPIARFFLIQNRHSFMWSFFLTKQPA